MCALSCACVRAYVCVVWGKGGMDSLCRSVLEGLVVKEDFDGDDSRKNLVPLE